jgi:glycosyltransferase involved in cell wall biosynthesis
VRLAAFSGASQFAGAERVLGDLLAHLDPAIEVSVLGPDRAVREALAARRPGTRTVEAGGIRNKGDIAAMRRWIGALRALRPDIVQINLIMPWASRHETLLSLATPGPRVIAVEHAPLPFDSGRLRHLLPLLYARLDGHVAVGAGAARTVERNAGLPQGSVTPIPPGVEPFEPPPRARRGAAPRIGTIARLDPVKNLDHLLRALAELPGVELEIVGDGPEGERLRALASELGVADRVRFAGWSTNSREWLGRWDALVLPSSVEGLPLVILDALLARLPVIATPVGSVTAAITHEQTGLLVPLGNPPAIAHAVRRLLADAALADRLRDAGRALVLERYTAPTMGRAYERLYAEILGGNY